MNAQVELVLAQAVRGNKVVWRKPGKRKRASSDQKHPNSERALELIQEEPLELAPLVGDNDGQSDPPVPSPADLVAEGSHTTHPRVNNIVGERCLNHRARDVEVIVALDNFLPSTSMPTASGTSTPLRGGASRGEAPNNQDLVEASDSDNENQLPVHDQPCEVQGLSDAIFNSEQLEHNLWRLGQVDFQTNQLAMREGVTDLMLRIEHSSRLASWYNSRKVMYKQLYKRAKTDLDAQTKASESLRGRFEKARETIQTQKSQCARTQALQDQVLELKKVIEEMKEKSTSDDRLLVLSKERLDGSEKARLELNVKLEESERERVELSAKLEECELASAARTRSDVVEGVKRFMRSPAFDVVCALNNADGFQAAFDRAYNQLNHLGAIYEDAEINEIGLHRDDEMRPILGRVGGQDSTSGGANDDEFGFAIAEIHVIDAERNAAQPGGDYVQIERGAQDERELAEARGERELAEARGERELAEARGERGEVEARSEREDESVMVETTEWADGNYQCTEDDIRGAEQIIGDVMDHIDVDAP